MNLSRQIDFADRLGIEKATDVNLPVTNSELTGRPEEVRECNDIIAKGYETVS